MIVNWHPDHGDTLPIPAVVTEVGGDVVGVSIIQKDMLSLVVKSGCRHHEDPRNVREGDRESGFWSHTGFTKRIMAILAKGEGSPKAA
jgi:hypothetical protein